MSDAAVLSTRWRLEFIGRNPLVELVRDALDAAIGNLGPVLISFPCLAVNPAVCVVACYNAYLHCCCLLSLKLTHHHC
jgi:hypothetical protein